MSPASRSLPKEDSIEVSRSPCETASNLLHEFLTQSLNQNLYWLQVKSQQYIFLRSHGIPVPKIYGYSAVADNPAGTEYIFMELVQGQNLGDIWFTLSEQERITLVT